MQRSIRYGLYGAVLAGIVGGAVSMGRLDNRVHLVVDGQEQTVSTGAGTVGEVLSAAGLHAGAHDILAPGANAVVHDGERIVLRRGREILLDVDGVRTRIWTTAPTVREAVGALGYDATDFVSVSRSERLPLTPMSITVRTPRQLTVVHDGHRVRLTTTAPDAQRLFDDMGVDVRPSDRLSVSATAPLRTGQTIRLTRIDHKRSIMHLSVPFKTQRIADSHLAAGKTKVVKNGKVGTRRVTYLLVYVDGHLKHRAKTASTLVSRPITKIIKVGTKLLAPTGSDPNPAALQAYARALLPRYGWSDSQFSCLVTMWDHESGWRVHAANPSGAYGIPQALPGSKMGPGWQSDAGVQIRWGLGYIKSRYGSPCGAWAFWQQGSWY